MFLEYWCYIVNILTLIPKNPILVENLIKYFKFDIRVDCSKNSRTKKKLIEKNSNKINKTMYEII